MAIGQSIRPESWPEKLVAWVGAISERGNYSAERLTRSSWTQKIFDRTNQGLSNGVKKQTWKSTRKLRCDILSTGSQLCPWDYANYQPIGWQYRIDLKRLATDDFVSNRTASVSLKCIDRKSNCSSLTLTLYADVIEFDNSFSYLRSKKIWYSITVTEPIVEDSWTVPFISVFYNSTGRWNVT